MPSDIVTPPGYTHILFDHDGVLVDTEHLYCEATCRQLALLGVTFSAADYLKIQAVGGDAWRGARDLGLSDTDIEAAGAARNEHYQALLCSREIDVPGVDAALTALGQRCTMAIVTTARQSDFDLIHRNRTIVDHMAFVLTNKDYARSKPYPDPYLTALDRFGIAAESALVVEDSQRGLAAAVAAGIDCAVVHHPFTASQDFSEARYRIETLADLLELVN
ncbi:MAG: HAD family phosphatase [Pseudomonadota bacterium]